MGTPTDSTGRSLTDYPRPSVAVDVAVLTVDEVLKVLVVERPEGSFALPGTFLHPGERLAEAAERALRDKAGLTGVDFHQLAMLDDPERDDRGWVLSMAHGAAVPVAEIPAEAHLAPTTETTGLAFDHAEIVDLAVADLRRRYSAAVDPGNFLGEQFTVLDLRMLYETVYARSYPKDTFRRHLLHGLEPTGELRREGTGRPAEIYRRRDAPLPSSTAAFLLQ
ncbi:NUDIX hydrolase [Rhodococcus sp. R1101]|uniref:NUDIX hydrolase n=1 Tax=Rhodococcus sp. R1101 TaxID=1170698 RepID=UPI00037AA6AB|nr:NUDIX domain-containing protein [Rhodococcus sp. R1101]